MKARDLALLSALCLAAPAGLAGSFEVNPIRVDLTPAARAAAVTVRNSGAEPVVVQASVQSWAQQDGKDVLAPTSEVLVSPPIATIQPGGQQIVRVGLRRAPDDRRQLSYRLFLHEVPPPPRPGFQGLQVALRIGLPVFVQPKSGPAKPDLVWNARLRDPGTVSLRLENNGNGHIQISDVQIYLPGENEPVASQSALNYVLPGQSRAWDLKLRDARVKGTEQLRLKVSTDAGAIDTGIELRP